MNEPQTVRPSLSSRLLQALEHQALALLIVVALVAYLLINQVAPRLPAGVNMYLVQPLAWLLPGGLAFYLVRRGWTTWPRPAQRLLLFAALMGVIQVLSGLLGGIFSGLGYSPYTHRLPALLGNLWYLLAGLAGLEAFRATLVHALTKRSPLLAAGLGSLLPALLLISIARWQALSTPSSLLVFLGAILLPSLAEGLLAALLAWVGGPLPAMLYRGIGLLFEWLSPVLPNLPWLIKAFIGTLVPLFGFFYLQNYLTPAEPEAAAGGASHHGTLSAWWWVLILGVTLFWFNTGFFGVRPFVVSGYSMKPTFAAGDVVLIVPVDPAEVEVGDIIQFRLLNNSVAHRVVAIEMQDGRYIFHTRGDNNNVDDDPVPQEALQGRVILVIPRVGWPALGVKQVLRWLF